MRYLAIIDECCICTRHSNVAFSFSIFLRDLKSIAFSIRTVEFMLMLHASGRASILRQANWDPLRTSTPLGAIFSCKFLVEFSTNGSSSKSHLMRPNNAQRVGEKVTTSILFSITKFCSAAYTDASVGGCGACFVTISESELLAFSIPHVPSIGVFGQGVFVYHGFAVQLAPWFIYSARAVPPEVLGFSTYAHSWCITHRLNAVQKLLG